MSFCKSFAKTVSLRSKADTPHSMFSAEPPIPNQLYLGFQIHRYVHNEMGLFPPLWLFLFEKDELFAANESFTSRYAAKRFTTSYLDNHRTLLYSRRSGYMLFTPFNN